MRRHSAAPISPGMRLVFLILAMVGTVGLMLFAAIYPPGKIAAVTWIAVFAGVLCTHRMAWLVLLPGLMPVVDLVLWTGGFYLAESDALVLSVLVTCGLRGALMHGVDSDEPSGWHFGILSWSLLILMLASYLLSTHWGAASGFFSQPELRVSYFSALNGVRLTKGMLWAVLLLPLVADSFRRRPTQAGQALVWGILLGLVLVTLATVWERYLFTGLSNFASDYRTTALFWEMNVGGATLDGWLALSAPFALRAVLQPASPQVTSKLLAVLALVGYACFTTFSRGLYAGLALGCAVTVVLWARNELRHGRIQFSLSSVLTWGCYVILLGAVLILVFRTGGYRGLIAMLGLAVAVFAVAPQAVRQPGRVWMGAAVLVLMAFVGSALAMYLLPKGVYLVYVASAAVVGALLICKKEGDDNPLRTTLLLAAFGWLAGNAVLVTTWWSEGSGLEAGTLAVLILFAPFVKVIASPRTVWRLTVSSGIGVTLVLGVLTMGVVASGTYYAGKRFETVGKDTEDRFQHWVAAASLPNRAKESWFGIGVGQFAERYFWQTPERMLPGIHQFASDESMNRFLRLIGPQHQLGFGELYRVSQRVSPTLTPPLLVSFDARVSGERKAVQLHLEACRKHLLYAQGCTIKGLRVPSSEWQHFETVLDKGDLGLAGRPPRPTVFSLAAASNGGTVDIARVSLVDARGIELLDNGSFSAGGDFWFFSSDMFHLPWHAENLWLHYWVEQGWFGVVAFTLFGLVALWRVSVGRAAHHPLAPALAGALLAFFSVGAFSSLIDAPRLTTFAFMLMLLALGLQTSSNAKTPGKETHRHGKANFQDMGYRHAAALILVTLGSPQYPWIKCHV